MKALIVTGVLILLCACSPRFPGGESWRDYHVARHALHVVYDRAAVSDCEPLGEVSGKSRYDVGDAKEHAISQAVLLGADHILFDQIETDFEARSFFLPYRSELITAYGIAYRCGVCQRCIDNAEVP
ncbi:MAG: hypothetical protein C0618_11635 [Desulfuromonas sp.]|nr:MAG: hypothetical protein C0618_11635 [Desulfuromonas sp.]